MEAGELGLYMFFVCMFTTLLQHPTSPVRHLVPTAIVRRAIMGLLVGSTVVAIILTPWGKQSGGHFNPAIALTFYRLGKVEFWDTLFYVTAQFTGAAGGVGNSRLPASRFDSRRCCAVRSDGARHIWQRRGARGRSEHLFHPDDCHPVCLKSRSAGAIHSLCGGSPVRHLYNLRNTTFRDKHESSANLRLSFPRRLLASDMGLFSLRLLWVCSPAPRSFCGFAAEFRPIARS